MWPLCGVGAASLECSHSRRRYAALRKDRQKLPPGARSKKRALPRETVDKAVTPRLYNSSWRAAASVRWRVCEAPHCLRGESSGQALAMSDVRASAAPVLAGVGP